MNEQFLQNTFRQVDCNNNGSICAAELQMALKNGLQTPFNLKTVELMIVMFDQDHNGTMSYPEFAQLFRYVQNWMQCFRQYDRDNSGSINCAELTTVLSSAGFRLSPQFMNLLVYKFDRTKRGSVAFDDFMHACICLQNLTQAFMVYDTRRNGYAQMSYEQFLTAAFSIIA